MSPTIVDGSFGNPLVVVAVVGWGVLLGLALNIAVRWFRHAGRQNDRPPALALIFVVVAFLYAATPWALPRIAAVLSLANHPVPGVSAGTIRFDGGPPLWPPVAIGVVLGLGGWQRRVPRSKVRPAAGFDRIVGGRGRR